MNLVISPFYFIRDKAKSTEIVEVVWRDWYAFLLAMVFLNNVLLMAYKQLLDIISSY